MTWLEYYGVLSSILDLWVMLLRGPDLPGKDRLSMVELIDYENANQIIYDKLISNKRLITTKCNQWEMRLHIEMTNDEFCKNFQNIYSATNCTKYRDFQYRLLMNIIVTNTKLKLWKIKDGDLCSFCYSKPEKVIHLFWECEHIKKLWEEVKELINELIPENVNLEFTVENVIFNKVHNSSFHIVNFIILVKHIECVVWVPTSQKYKK